MKDGGCECRLAVRFMGKTGWDRDKGDVCTAHGGVPAFGGLDVLSVPTIPAARSEYKSSTM